MLRLACVVRALGESKLMQAPVRIPYVLIDRIHVAALIYSIPVSNSPSSSSDVTHGNVDNNAYQVAR
jgi:hypothetical protein